MVPFARGFFDIHFDSESDMKRVWGGGSCMLNNSIFRQPDFDPYSSQVQTHAQVWIKIYGLSMEYWSPRILMRIARGIGMPLQLDKARREKIYRSRVLVDLSGPLTNSLMIERPNQGFPVEIGYENLPTKCSGCGRIGHSLSSCRIEWKNPMTTKIMRGVA